MSTAAGDAFILRIEPGAGAGPRVAVKDLVDVAGLPTSHGCRALAAGAMPAADDAACVAAVRAGGGRIVGKTALHELAYGITGINAWYGTPVNPLDPTRVPGGSSSGSAVAVATGEADVAVGTDTGGSVRIPAACCGVAGLKTTLGQLQLAGVRALAPSFDTVGPMAATVAGVALGYELMGGRTGGSPAPGRVRRLRGLDGVDPEIDAAIDAALDAAGVVAEGIEIPGWRAAFEAHRVILHAEAFATNGHLLAPETRGGLGEETRRKLEHGATIAPSAVGAAREVAVSFREELRGAGIVALPTIPCPPPRLEDDPSRLVWLTAPVNLAGVPALSLPVPLAPATWQGGRASLQLMGPSGSESQLLELGRRIEDALR